MKKDYIQFGKNRNSRFVLTKESVSYTKEKIGTVCVGRFTITFRGEDIVKNISVVGYCRKAKGDVENEDFAKHLARAKMEKAAYEQFKSLFCNTYLDDLYKQLSTFIKYNLSYPCIAYYIMNSINFADKMIKHQKEYINKISVNGLTPKNSK